MNEYAWFRYILKLINGEIWALVPNNVHNFILSTPIRLDSGTLTYSDSIVEFYCRYDRRYHIFQYGNKPVQTNQDILPSFLPVLPVSPAIWVLIRKYANLCSWRTDWSLDPMQFTPLTIYFLIMGLFFGSWRLFRIL